MGGPRTLDPERAEGVAELVKALSRRWGSPEHHRVGAGALFILMQQNQYPHALAVTSLQGPAVHLLRPRGVDYPGPSPNWRRTPELSTGQGAAREGLRHLAHPLGEINRLQRRDLPVDEPFSDDRPSLADRRRNTWVGIAFNFTTRARDGVNAATGKPAICTISILDLADPIRRALAAAWGQSMDAASPHLRSGALYARGEFKCAWFTLPPRSRRTCRIHTTRETGVTLLGVDRFPPVCFDSEIGADVSDRAIDVSVETGVATARLQRSAKLNAMGPGVMYDFHADIDRSNRMPYARW